MSKDGIVIFTTRYILNLMWPQRTTQSWIWPICWHTHFHFSLTTQQQEALS